MTSSYLKASVFVCSKEKDEPTFSQISTLSIAFKNLYFWCPKTLFMDGRLKQRKILCFQKYPDSCGQGLNDSITSGFSPSWPETYIVLSAITAWLKLPNNNQLLIELILIPFQLQNLPIYTRNRLDAFYCVNGLSYSSHLLRKITTQNVKLNLNSLGQGARCFLAHHE